MYETNLQKAALLFDYPEKHYVNVTNYYYYYYLDN